MDLAILVGIALFVGLGFGVIGTAVVVLFHHLRRRNP